MAVNDSLPPKHYPIPPRTAPHNSGLRPQYGEPDAAPRTALCEPCDDVRPSTSPMVNAFWGGGTSLCPAVESSDVHRFYNAKYARTRAKTRPQRRGSEPCGLLPRLAGPANAPGDGGGGSGGGDAGDHVYEAEASRALVRSRSDAERCLVSQQYDAKLKVLDAAWEHFVQLHRCGGGGGGSAAGAEPRRYVFSLKCVDDGTTLWEVDSADAREACDAQAAAGAAPHSGSELAAAAAAAAEGYGVSRALGPPVSAQAPPPTEEQLALPAAGGGGDARPSRALAGPALAGVAPSMETALSAAFRRALRYAGGREESMAAELSEARRQLEEATGAGSVFRGLQQANGRLRLEAAASREKMAELVGLTERLGAEVRGLRTKNEQLAKEVQWVSKTTATEQAVYQEARRLALRLQVQVDELESMKTDQQVQQMYAQDLLAKSRRRNRLLENERRVLLKTRGPDVEELVKGLYTRFKADQEKDGEKRGERLTGGAGGESTVRPFLKGLGTNSSVPVSLRHAGRVRNLKLGKGTIERIIREVWVARYSVHVQTQELPAIAGGRVIGGAAAEVALKCAVRDEAFDTIDYGNVQKIIGGRVPFQRFFHEYVTERWHNAVEWAYSILDACERYRYDADVEMFLEIWKGHLPEDAFIDQHVMLHKFKKVLTGLDVPTHVVEKWKERQQLLLDSERRDDADDADPPDAEAQAAQAVTEARLRKLRKMVAADLTSAELVLTAVQRFFHTKSPEHLAALQASLLKDVAAINKTDVGTLADVFVWEELFEEDEDGSQLAFVETLRDQHLEEVALFTAALADAIDASTSDGHLRLCDLKQNVLDLDPHRPHADVHSWLQALCGSAPSVSDAAAWTRLIPAPPLFQLCPTLLQRRFGEPYFLRSDWPQ